MNTTEMARRVGSAARVLVAASLFFVLVWWKISLVLFGAGWVVLAAAWLMDGAALKAAPSLFTAPE